MVRYFNNYLIANFSQNEDRSTFGKNMDTSWMLIAYYFFGPPCSLPKRLRENTLCRKISSPLQNCHNIFCLLQKFRIKNAKIWGKSPILGNL